MKIQTTSLALALFLIASTLARAEDFKSERIHGRGKVTNRCNVIIVGDGWTQADLNSGNYAKAAKTVSDYLVGKKPFKDYANLISVTRIDVPSVESGISHKFGNINKNTYYGAEFPATVNATGTADGDHRGLWFKDENATATKLNQTNPGLQRQVAVVLCNDGVYGGAARFTGTASAGYCTVSTNSAANDVFFHELGHALCNLADEYAYGKESQAAPAKEPEEANVTIDRNARTVKWMKWFPAGTTPAPHNCPTPSVCPSKGLGLHEEAKYALTGVWRPLETCLMRELNTPMCDVCCERTVQRFYENVSIVDGHLPVQTGIELQANAANSGVGAAQNFLVLGVAGKDTKIEATWFIDGAAASGTSRQNERGAIFELSVPATRLPPGNHTVRVLVQDKTPLVKDWPSTVPVEYRMPNNVQWSVFVKATGIIPRLRQVVGW